MRQAIWAGEKDFFMKKRAVIYINREDPRRFLFCDPSRKWKGGVLNFAAKGSLLIFLITTLACILPAGIAFYCGSLFFTILTAVLWAVCVYICYYRKAESEMHISPDSDEDAGG